MDDDRSLNEKVLSGHGMTISLRPTLKSSTWNSPAFAIFSHIISCIDRPLLDYTITCHPIHDIVARRSILIFVGA